MGLAIRKVIITAVTCAAILFGCPDVHAEKTIKWKDVGGWNIRVDQTVGDGCFIATAYEGGTVLRFGFNQTYNNAYVMIGNKDWASIEEGKEYPLTVQFDRKPKWNGNATAVSLSGGFIALYLPFSETDFFSEFARSHGVRVFYDNVQVANLTLRGSFAAVREMLNCQKQFKATKSTNASVDKDPFAQGATSRRVSDPFAR